MKMVNIVLLTAGFCILTFTVTHGEEIINGVKAEKNSLQFMASVQKNKKHKCGGFLIHPSFVLTAAHCNISDISVVLGTHNIDPGNKKMKRYTVKGLQMHPEYQFNKTYLGYDIMLLKLEKKVKLNKDVKIVKIPKKLQRTKPKTKCQVAGWGQTEDQDWVKDLLVTDVSTIDMKICKMVWKKLPLPPNVLCAGGYKTNNGACKGDSGGPLVCHGEAVGIVSFRSNSSCIFPDAPNVYTEIAQYIDWINDVINNYV